MRSRVPQCLLIVSWLGFSWLGMQAVHELGHVAAAWATGGTVQRVVLDPRTISRTDVMPNPRPLIVAWAGPLFGTALPLLVWGVFRLGRVRGVFLARFFAGACLVANGVYLGAGSFGHVGDAGDILHYGCPVGLLWLFALATAPLGLLLWNNQGVHFGLGQARGNVDPRAVRVSCALFTATVVAMLLWG